MRRGVGAFVVITLALLALAAGRAQASTGAQFGIQDDAWLMYGPGSLEERLTTLDGLGARTVRFTLRWDQVAPSRPAAPRNPDDPAYRWGAYGDVLDALHTRGFTALVTLYGAPRWANGGGPGVRLPATGFGDFAYAAARRFPWIRLWTAWNEPNNGVFASPVSPARYVSRVLNPAYAALHQANRANKVAGGITSPRKTPSGMAPLSFMQGMRAAHARLDAYAVNPYPLSRNETPSRTTCARCGYFTMASLPAIRANVTRNFGAKPLWLTEYGYQTSPPDRILGVSQALQARYLGEAAHRVWRQPGVTILIQYLVRDEPSLGGWQSGLYTAGGVPKLSAHAFALPLAQAQRVGARVSLWGEVRPGVGPRAYVLQVKRGRAWRSVATGRTGGSGAFARTIAAPRGAQVRVWAPALGFASPALPVS
jgi:hypothetical protein